jgi:hypothetical protein
VDRTFNQNKDCKSGHDTVSNKLLNSNSMFLAPVTEDEVLNVTSKLKGKFSVGCDEIREKLVKESIQFDKKTLTFMFNISLCSGTFPDLMKIARSLAYSQKRGERRHSNYRPISVLPVFKKILEMLIYKRLVTFLNKQHDI